MLPPTPHPPPSAPHRRGDAVGPAVPTRYGVVLGSIIGGALLLVALLVAVVYLLRFCWLRRQAVLQRRLR